MKSVKNELLECPLRSSQTAKWWEIKREIEGGSTNTRVEENALSVYLATRRSIIQLIRCMQRRATQSHETK